MFLQHQSEMNMSQYIKTYSYEIVLILSVAICHTHAERNFLIVHEKNNNNNNRESYSIASQAKWEFKKKSKFD